MVLTPRKGVT